MRKLLTLLMAVFLLTACSSDGTVDTTATPPATSTTTAALTTSTTAAATTTTDAPPTTSTVVEELGPEGSGCTPGSDQLPDGLWYGQVGGFDDEGVAFDLACWFSGEAAAAAAAEDGEESPPPNDYYVRNQNEQLRDLAVVADTPVLWYLSGDPSDSQQGTFAEWVDFLATQEFRLGIWVTIDDGAVTQIEEQWVP